MSKPLSLTELSIKSHLPAPKGLDGATFPCPGEVCVVGGSDASTIPFSCPFTCPLWAPNRSGVVLGVPVCDDRAGVHLDDGVHNTLSLGVPGQSASDDCLDGVRLVGVINNRSLGVPGRSASDECLDGVREPRGRLGLEIVWSKQN